MNTVSASVAPPSQTTASTLTTSKYCSNLARSWPQSASLNSLNHSLQVYLQTCSIMASECISKLTAWCCKSLELERRNPLINTLAHFAWHPKGICEKERFWLEERTNRVRGYEDIPTMMNRTNCFNLWKLGKSAWDRVLEKIECVFFGMRWCLSTPGSSKYILPVAESISVIPVSSYVYIYRDVDNTCHIMMVEILWL